MIHPGFEAAKNFSIEKYDTTRVEYQLAGFLIKEEKFVKLAAIDYRNYRMEVWEERMTRWVGFQNGFVFNFSKPEELDPLYELYKNHIGRIRYRSKEKLIEWFLEPAIRITFMPPEPEELDELQYNDMFNPKSPNYRLNRKK